MKILGIICEYNPFHIGHLRHIDFCKKIYGEDTLLCCVMSGNFTQRGLPAVLDKHTRAKHAILAGADAVIELPFLFSTGSATDFANGGVKILGLLNANGICCGSECGNVEEITKLSKRLLNPTSEFNAKIKEILSLGENYPTAVSRAEKELFGSDLLSLPNNLLAVEYAKSVFTHVPDTEFFTIARDSDYRCDSSDSVTSAAIRKAFFDRELKKIKNNVPDYVFKDLNDADASSAKRFYDFLPLALSTKTKTELSDIAEVSEGIENLLYDNLCFNYDEYVAKIKTKRYTRLKLNRILLYGALGIDKKIQEVKRSATDIPLKLLAVKNDDKVLKAVLPKIDEINERNKTSPEYITIEESTEKSDRFYNTIFNIVQDKNQKNKIRKY